MDRKKDISQLFKENQQKLEEMPSHHAWRKLESRLDAHKSRNRLSLYRSMSMVAALIALVAVTFVVSLLLEQRLQKPFALADDLALPLELETIDTYTDFTPGAYKAVEFRRKHTNRLTNPIVEGVPGKKLLATKKSQDNFNEVADKQDEIKNNETNSHIKLTPALQQFSWLLGNWKGAAQEGASFEKWMVIDPYTIKGESYIKVEGQLVFKEYTLIKDYKGEIFYYFPLVNTQEATPYKLIVLAGETAIFENEDIVFPNQIVFEKVNANNFKTILQNKEPAEINALQEEYFSNRYAIQKEQAVRSLHRLNK